MAYLLDTDHLVVLQSRDNPGRRILQARLKRCASGDVHASIVSFHELVNGWAAFLGRKRSPGQVVHAYAKFEELIAEFAASNVVGFSDSAAELFEQLRSQGVHIGTMDLRIAAIALAGGWTVLSRNLVDFDRVPGLVVEDWTSAPPDKPK